MKDLETLLIENDKMIKALSAIYSNRNVEKEMLESVVKDAITSKYKQYDSSKSQFSTFASVIAQSAIIDYLRKHSSVVTYSEADDIEVISIEDLPFAEDSLPYVIDESFDEVDIGLKDTMELALDGLFDDYEDYFLITRLFGVYGHNKMFLTDIAKVMGKNVKTIKKDLDRIMDVLKEDLQLQNFYEKIKLGS